MITLASLSARGPSERGRPRPVLTNMSLEHRSGVLGILGAPKDGTSLLLDVIDGTEKPTAGRVSVFGTSPEGARSRVARVSLDAPLPDALRVDEVCDLASELRGEPRVAAAERLGVIGLAALSRRTVRSLSLEERRSVTLAIALTSPKSEVVLVEEPLVALEPVAPRLVEAALRQRAASACVIITTASARDATRLADRLGILTSGVFAPLPHDLALAGAGVQGERPASIRLVVASSAGRSGAAALTGILGADDAVARVETSTFAAANAEGGHAVAVVVSGADLGRLARAVTHAIATARIDVELVEPSVLSTDAVRAALAAHNASPPPGSLPPSSQHPPASIPPSSLEQQQQQDADGPHSTGGAP